MMDTNASGSTEQGQDSAVSVPSSLGRTLRAARESMGLSIAEVADQVKFAARQIEALEADDFQHLPEMTFVRGFVRSYAKILHLDAQALLALLPQSSPVPQQLVTASVEVPFPTAQTAQRINLVWLGAALLLAVLIVVFVVWQYTRPVAPSASVNVETSLALPAEVQTIGVAPPEASVAAAPVEQRQAAPVAVKPVTVVPPQPAASAAVKPAAIPALPSTQASKPAQPDVAAKPGVLRLVFDEESWTEIRNRDDKIISSQVNPRGTELNVDGRAPLSLVIGHAASVHLYYRDKPVDLTPYINSSSEVARLTLE